MGYQQLKRIGGTVERGTKEGGEGLGGLEEFGGVDGILLVLVDSNVNEGALDCVEEVGHCGGGGWRLVVVVVVEVVRVDGEMVGLEVWGCMDA